MSTSASPRIPAARSGAAVLAALACGGAALLATPAAAADPDGGVIRIHRDDIPLADLSDESTVCGFHLVGAEFASGRRISWSIAPQAQQGAQGGISGNIALPDGAGRSRDLMLPDGQYTLTWNVVGGQAAGTQRKFTVDCTTVTATAEESKSQPLSAPQNPPTGAVLAGGGGAASTAGPSSFTLAGATAAAAVTMAGGLILARRTARRRGDGAA